MKNIAILASGNGSNAENIINYYRNNSTIYVKLIITDNPNAFVIERAKQLGVSCIYLTRSSIRNGNELLEILKENRIDWVVLAGFLMLIPKNVIDEFKNKIINIHPALLPKYGGKGMYGIYVHKKVIENGDNISGITIHYVNESYDEGDIIFQKSCDVAPYDNEETLAQKIHELEYQYYPKIIEQTILS